MRSIQRRLKDEGVAVPMTKLCRWFEVAHRTTYYSPPERRRRSTPNRLHRSRK